MILGHHRLMQRLWTAAAAGGLHHALLLEGPAGVGKHTLALRLACGLNCERSSPAQGPDACPCAQCPTCRAILAGTHPDLISIAPPPDSASGTIPVEAIREVTRQVGYHRYSARERVVVIDPAEAMQESAANALLKTLEEPPPGTRFVLVTSGARALLPTIRSRCQQVRLGPVSELELVTWLEKRGLADATLLARLAHGCPGRALALAEGGLAERREVRDAVLQALAGDLGTLLAASQSLAEGKRAGRANAAIDAIEDLVRDAAVAATGASVSGSWGADDRGAQAWGTALWPGGVATLADAVASAREQLAVNVPARLVLDALFTAAATELGAARKTVTPSG